MPSAMKKGVDKTVNLPLNFGWHTSDEYIIAGGVIIPIAIPIIVRPIISSMNSNCELSRLEKPIMSHEIIAITLTNTSMLRLPNLSDRKPDKGPPIGQAIAVTEANHDT